MTNEEKLSYQKYKSPINNAYFTKRIFSDYISDVMKWEARNTDLRLIENLWFILERRMYAKYWKFKTFKELKWALTNFWQLIEENVLQALSNSMLKRCKDVIKCHVMDVP